MREIKFRGKRIDNGEWVYGYLIEKNVIVGEIVEFCEDYFNTEYWWKVDPETAGQYTGLKDKNGKEIYEGDILHVIEQGQYGGEYNVPVKWVEWDDKYTENPRGEQWAFWGCVCAEAKEIAHHENVTTLFTRGFLTRRFGSCIQLCEMTDRNIFDIEVIGNIYENPELLKGEENA